METKITIKNIKQLDDADAIITLCNSSIMSIATSRFAFKRVYELRASAQRRKTKTGKILATCI